MVPSKLINTKKIINTRIIVEQVIRQGRTNYSTS